MSNQQDKSSKKTKSKEYWTQETEDAVRVYLRNDFNYYSHRVDKHIEEVQKSVENNAKNSRIKTLELDAEFINYNNMMIDKTSEHSVIRLRDETFRRSIYKPLIKLVENIIFTYKLFIDGVDIKTLHNDCMSHVIEKFCNFEPEQNTKSFSFYGTIAKHYLQNKKKDHDKSVRVALNYDNHIDEADEVTKFEIDEESDLDSSMALFNFVIEFFSGEIERVDISKNDAKVADAIVEIFKNRHHIESPIKSIVYKLIKEHTNLDTKDITYSLHRFKILYRVKKKEFMDRHEDRYYGFEDEIFPY